MLKRLAKWYLKSYINDELQKQEQKIKSQIEFQRQHEVTIHNRQSVDYTTVAIQRTLGTLQVQKLISNDNLNKWIQHNKDEFARHIVENLTYYEIVKVNNRINLEMRLCFQKGDMRYSNQDDYNLEIEGYVKQVYETNTNSRVRMYHGMKEPTIETFITNELL